MSSQPSRHVQVSVSYPSIFAARKAWDSILLEDLAGLPFVDTKPFNQKQEVALEPRAQVTLEHLSMSSRVQLLQSTDVFALSFGLL